MERQVKERKRELEVHMTIVRDLLESPKIGAQGHIQRESDSLYTCIYCSPPNYILRNTQVVKECVHVCKYTCISATITYDVKFHMCKCPLDFVDTTPNYNCVDSNWIYSRYTKFCIL